jgi:lysozyme
MRLGFIIDLINEGGDPNRWADQELPLYVNDQSGKQLSNLVERRKAEIALFKTSSTVKALPAPPC